MAGKKDKPKEKPAAKAKPKETQAAKDKPKASQAPPAGTGGPDGGEPKTSNAPESGTKDYGVGPKEAPRGKFASCAKFCCNKEEGSCCGRTCLSWLKILIFYMIFYIGLFTFFLALLFFHLYFRSSERTPGLLLKDSLIGDPGLGYRPTNDDKDSALIWYNKEEEASYAKYVQLLSNITKKDKGNSSYVHCHNINKNLAEELKEHNKTEDTGSCSVYDDTRGKDANLKDQWGECTPGNNFGFKDGRPCILIRINRIIGWTPGLLPESIPYDISTLGIPDPDKKKDSGVTRPLNKTMDKVVCIYCEGENHFDKEVLGEVKYYPGGHRPGPCIPGFFFPYKNQPFYLSPFIFVQFPKLPLATLVQVRCTAYNKKINHDTQKGLGMVRFELLVDNNKSFKE